jgi:hypothetical protein
MPARFSYKNDSDEDRANPQKEAARRLQEQEQQSDSGYASSGIDQLESFANDPNNHDNAQSVREAEDEPAGGWKSNVSGDGGNKKTPFTAKAKNFFKKRGALVTILSAFGIGGGLLAGFAGPSSMLIAATQNLYSQNDSSSVSMERRFMKVFGFTTSTDNDPICANSSKSIKCKMGQISNKALKQLEAKGITAVPERTGNTGYPDKNPTSYKIDVAGVKSTVAAKDLPGFLADNPKIAAKVLGTGGAFNLRVKAWTSKYITKKLYEKVGIKRNGGLADGENKSSSASERLSEITKKLEAKIPGFKTDGAVDGIKGKVTSQLEATKKGGVGYTLAVGSCIAPKAPGYVAAGIAAVQLAQVLPLMDEVITSPGEKAMASGLDKDAKFTGDDMSSVGALLTEKTKGADGTTASALDSPVLLSAMGINKGKPAVSTKYTPGYSALTNPIVKASNIVDKNLAPACNVIMSPAAMYSAMAVDSAITVAASSTVIGGLIKVGVSVAVQYIAQQAIEKYVGTLAQNVLEDVAKNDDIPKAKGKDLGDVLGVSALSYFSAGGMAHNLPTLKKSQMSEFVAMQKETQNQQRQMDIASLSPFDISSQYTFLGSIVHTFGTASISSNANSGGLFTQVLGYLKTPFTSISTSANAADFSDQNCGYAADFGLDAGENSPAINAAGLPCTGITDQQAGMSSDNALSLITGQGWIDETKDLADDATIDDMVSSGYIVKDTPLADYIRDCGDATTGDYLFNSASCSIDSSTKDPNSSVKSGNCDGPCTGDPADFGESGNGTSKSVSAEALAAMPVFLLDYQIHQAINGEDDAYAGGSSAPSSAAGGTIDQAHIYEDSTSVACAAGTTDAGVEQGYYNGKEVDVRLCTIPNTIDNGPDGNNGLIRVNSRVSGAFLSLTQAFISSGKNPYGDKVRFADSFRSMAAQRQVYAQYGSGRAAAPGFSNHQMGLAVDIQLQSNNGATRPGDPTYDWLVANAKTWGITKLTSESWHWQPQAGQGSAVL